MRRIMGGGGDISGTSATAGLLPGMSNRLGDGITGISPPSPAWY